LQITFKLYAGLAQYLPSGSEDNAIEVELPDGQSIPTLIQRYHVPLDQVHLVLLNGVYQDSAARVERVLQDGDTVAIWPAVAGG
jgi:molybdopterin synthase sulfur carrier subunit